MREQLAVEWKHDLGLIPLCNAELRRHRSEVVANHSDELEKLQYEIAPGSIEVTLALTLNLTLAPIHNPDPYS